MHIRLKYAGIEIKSRGGQTNVTVLLERGDTTYSGEAACSDQSFSRNRGIALATINAIRQFIAKEYPIELVDAGKVQFSGQAVALVSLNCREHGMLLGSAFIAGNSDTAFVFAVLDALNRRLSIART